MVIKTLLQKYLRSSLCYMVESCFVIMQQKKLKDITIAELTEKAGVHRSSFYRNFDSKEKIVELFFNCLFDEHLATLKYNNPQSRQEYIKLFFQSFYTYKTEILLCYQNGLIDYLMKLYEKEYLKNSNTDEEQLTAIYHCGGVHKILVWWIKQGMIQSPIKIAQTVNSMPEIKLIYSEFTWKLGK